jgi:ABC-type cobalamin/Fe3+-siderophores transport system ATPase subunit
MTVQVNTAQAKEILASTIKAKLVPMLAGSPGCGKSALVHQLAKENNLKVIDVRLAQCDPTDLLGFPDIDREANKARYVPMSIFPIEGDEVPEGYDGWLLFLDEFNAADRGVQKAAYKLILDHMIGEFNLHKRVAIVAAGNLDTDNAMVEEMTTALQSRLIHLELSVDQEKWLEWAAQNDIDHRITSYIKFKPSQLYSFKPDHSDKTYASPRTWEFANRFLQIMDIGDRNLLPTLAGTISDGVANEFIGFTRIYKDLPSLAEIIANPNGIPVPAEPSILFALTGSLANHADEDTIDDLMKYVVRMPIEFQVVCLREIHQRDRAMLKTQAVQDWISVNSTELF